METTQKNGETTQKNGETALKMNYFQKKCATINLSENEEIRNKQFGVRSSHIAAPQMQASLV